MIQDSEDFAIAEKKRAALDYLTEAWDVALAEGIEPEILAHAALFAALSDLIRIYGEEPVAGLVGTLGERIRRAEFTVGRTKH
ncbi:MAG: hypothetical protein U1E56_00180 [Bauldia sp.]